MMLQLRLVLVVGAAVLPACSSAVQLALPEGRLAAHPRDWMMEDTTTIDTTGMTAAQLFAATIEPSISHAELDSLRQLDPRTDARAAATRDDWQPWAVRGGVGTVQFPGLPAKARQQLLQHPFRVIRGTGDMLSFVVIGQDRSGQPVVDSTDYYWQEQAQEYADAYNRTLLALAQNRR